MESLRHHFLSSDIIGVIVVKNLMEFRRNSQFAPCRCCDVDIVGDSLAWTSIEGGDRVSHSITRTLAAASW
jgi:hypothetical protein